MCGDYSYDIIDEHHSEVRSTLVQAIEFDRYIVITIK
jgi:hypothetical protein